jgi:hypothetical protein
MNYQIVVGGGFVGVYGTSASAPGMCVYANITDFYIYFQMLSTVFMWGELFTVFLLYLHYCNHDKLSSFNPSDMNYLFNGAKLNIIPINFTEIVLDHLMGQYHPI